jgi:hypothetical protein
MYGIFYYLIIDLNDFTMQAVDFGFCKGDMTIKYCKGIKACRKDKLKGNQERKNARVPI